MQYKRNWFALQNHLDSNVVSLFNVCINVLHLKWNTFQNVLHNPKYLLQVFLSFLLILYNDFRRLLFTNVYPKHSKKRKKIQQKYALTFCGKRFQSTGQFMSPKWQMAIWWATHIIYFFSIYMFKYSCYYIPSISDTLRL